MDPYLGPILGKDIPNDDDRRFFMRMQSAHDCASQEKGRDGWILDFLEHAIFAGNLHNLDVSFAQEARDALMVRS
jgi:hypothetical protein